MHVLLILIFAGFLMNSCADSTRADVENEVEINEEAENKEMINEMFESANIQDSCITLLPEGPFKFGVEYIDADSSAYYTEGITEEMIIETMNSINWEEFHIVWLEDKHGCSLDVGGSLFEDGFASGYRRFSKYTGEFLCEMIISEAPVSVDQMTAIILSFFNGTDNWYTENNFE
jgi:hypothetical protein